jgi:hypothetical protein
MTTTACDTAKSSDDVLIRQLIEPHQSDPSLSDYRKASSMVNVSPPIGDAMRRVYSRKLEAELHSTVHERTMIVIRDETDEGSTYQAAENRIMATPMVGEVVRPGRRDTAGRVRLRTSG